jgi:hypothetical protein
MVKRRGFGSGILELVRPQMGQNSEHSAVVTAVGRQAELGQDVADVGLDGLGRQPEAFADPAVG